MKHHVQMLFDSILPHLKVNHFDTRLLKGPVTVLHISLFSQSASYFLHEHNIFCFGYFTEFVFLSFYLSSSDLFEAGGAQLEKGDIMYFPAPIRVNQIRLNHT